MSSLWGLTEMVLEGGAANDVYALRSRSKKGRSDAQTAAWQESRSFIICSDSKIF